MRASRLITILAAAATIEIASAAPVVIYDGTSSPTSQGWLRPVAQGNETVLPGGLTEFMTNTAPAALVGEQNIYRFSSAASNFIASIRLRVVSVTPHNTFDAALMFGVFDNAFALPGSSGDRSRMLAIDPAGVAWSDDSGASAVDTSLFHEYAIHYDNGQMNVYIDAAYADIAAGTATPALSRAIPPYATLGTIVFGDQTNDVNVDSHYIVDFVRFQNLAVAPSKIPTLSEWGLVFMSSMLAMFGISRTRRCPR